MSELFDDGRWEELEDRLLDALRRDPSDARSAFRLANLLSLEERWEEAKDLYDDAWSQRWPGVVCLNNRAVALARCGEAGPALDTLFRALEMDGAYRPAGYNLAIVLQRLVDDGDPPDLLAQYGLHDRRSVLLRAKEALRPPKDHPEGKAPSMPGGGDETPRAMPEPAQDEWGGGRDLLDGPLYLWKEDLATGFGFGPTASAEDLSEARSFFREGMDHLAAGEWQAAIEALSNAGKLWPDLAAQTLQPLESARLGLRRKLRETFRRRLAEGDVEGARTALEELAELDANAPDRLLLQELLPAEIRALSEQLRRREASPDWGELQRVVSAVRRRVEELTASEEPAQIEVERAPSDEGVSPSDEGEAEPRPEKPLDLGSAHARTIERARNACRDAWWQQVRFFIAIQRYDDAERMLDFTEIQWFARDDLPRWRRELFTSRAENLYAQASEALSRDEVDRALELLNDARVFARETNDQHITDAIDKQIHALQRRRERKSDVREIEGLLGRGEYLKALNRCTEMLEADPEQPTLRSQRDKALHRLARQFEDMIDAGQYEQTIQKTAEVLGITPEAEEIALLASTARHRLLGKLVAEGNNALLRGDRDSARDWLGKALEIDPEDPSVADLRRKIERDKRPEPIADEEFYEAQFRLREKLAAGDPRAALDELNTMRRIRTEGTKDLLRMIAVNLLNLWWAELAKDRTAANAEKIRREVLDLRGLKLDDFSPTGALLQELEEIVFLEDRRGMTESRLAEVRNLLTTADPRDPIAALQLLEAMEPIDNDLAKRAGVYREDAYRQCNVLIKKLDALVKGRKELTTGEVERLQELLSLCQQNDRSNLKSRIERLLENNRSGPERRRQVDEDFKLIKNSVAERSSHHDAFKHWHDITLRKHSEGSHVLEDRRADLIDIRERRRASLTGWERWRAERFERNHPLRRLLEKDSENEGKKK